MLRCRLLAQGVYYRRHPAWSLQLAGFQIDYFAETFNDALSATCAPDVRETWRTAAGDEPVPVFTPALRKPCSGVLGARLTAPLLSGIHCSEGHR
ncbi:hypothetical protein [Streptomyces niveus]|uniref:hypothetical protein n=1 Tax=Streptomyces niveus TaxID=193462 RepID=UPI0036D226DF